MKIIKLILLMQNIIWKIMGEKLINAKFVEKEVIIDIALGELHLATSAHGESACHHSLLAAARQTDSNSSNKHETA